MSSSFYFNQDSVMRFKKRKARFSFSEVHILLDEVRKNRHIVVGKFNCGVPSDVKKRAWAEITARVNEIGECEREVIEVVKKWSDLKCDTKRKVAAMRAGSMPFRSSYTRPSRELSPTENIVHQILELDGKRGRLPSGGGSAGPEDEDGPGGEEDDEDEMAMGSIHSSPGRGMEMPGVMPPPPPGSLGMPVLAVPQRDEPGSAYGGTSRDSSQSSFEMQYEIPTTDDHEPADSDDDIHDELLPSSSMLASNHTLEDVGPLPGGVNRVSAAPGLVPSAPPCPPASQGGARDRLAHSASLSVAEQHTTNALLETVSRSLELLSESVQQLAETQQEFVRESLQLQRETVQVLRDFASGALAAMHDKLNGRPAL